MAITKVTISDIPEVNLLVNSAYRGEESKKGWTSEEHLLDGKRIDEQMLSDYLSAKNITLLKYTDDDTKKIIGTILLEVKGTQLYMGMLTVAPLLQGKGTGKELLKAADDHAKQHNCQKITITVISARPELISWYERHGYVFTGNVEPFPDDSKFGTQKEPLEFIELEKVLVF
jgi:ribosomal protein S18 acetylase RimI-like enzyme